MIGSLPNITYDNLQLFVCVTYSDGTGLYSCLAAGIPPMPKFPVAPTTSDPGAYAEYKRQYEEYSTWYEKVSIQSTVPNKNLDSPFGLTCHIVEIDKRGCFN
jgi:hypothetical protein